MERHQNTSQRHSECIHSCGDWVRPTACLGEQRAPLGFSHYWTENILPDNMANKITPQPQMSGGSAAKGSPLVTWIHHMWLYELIACKKSLLTSGATYGRLPQLSESIRVLPVDLSLYTAQRPKSQILRVPAASRRRFSGFRSR